MANQEDKQVRVIAYIRKSSDDNEQGEAHKQLNSMEYQREWVKEAVKKHDLNLIRRPFEDDKSGYIAFHRDDENGFNKMIDYIKDKDNAVEGIICTEISRLARNFADGGLLLWYMQSNVVKHIYTPSKEFTNSSSDQLMVAIEMAMSKKSSDDTGYRTKAGMDTKVRTMKHPSRPAILGYKTEGRVGAKKWIIDEKIGNLVKDVFKKFTTGNYTFDQIAEYAYNLGLKSLSKRSGTGKYSANTWRNRLTDEQYIGIFYHNGERIVGEYEPLVKVGVFYEVQEIIRGNQHPKDFHIEYAYTGMIRCSLCNDMLSGTNKKGITYYRCAKRKAPCKNEDRKPYIPERELEETLIEAFNNIEIDQNTWNEARKYVDEINQPEKTNLIQQIRKFGGLVEAEEGLQIEIGRKYSEGKMSKYEHDRLIQDSTHKQASLRKTIVKLENYELELNQLMNNFLDNIKFVTRKFETALPQNKREMVDIFCENLMWDGQKARFDWTKPYFILAKQPNNSNVLPR